MKKILVLLLTITLILPILPVFSQQANDATNSSDFEYEVIGFSIGARRPGYYECLTHVAWFALHVDAMGEISDAYPWPSWLVDEAHSHDVSVLLTVEDFVPVVIDTDSMLSDYGSKLAQSLSELVQNRRADGVMVDFERVVKKDPLNQFMEILYSELKKKNPNYYVSICLPPSPIEAFDCSVLVNYADSFFIMAYNYDLGRPDAWPVSPLDGGWINIRTTIADYLSQADSRRFILGLPLYFRDWIVEQEPIEKKLEHPTIKDRVPYRQSCISVAIDEATKIYKCYVWNDETKTNWYKYKKDNEWHQCWFDDARSFMLKFNFALEQRLRGVGFWHLGCERIDIYVAWTIKRGLQWLREHQNPDGSWQSSVGITSMAALAFLNAGYDENDPTVSKAIQYILANRRGDGSFGWGTYETSTAVWALVATHNPNYHDEIAQAKDWLILAQYDEGEGATLDSACYGGWRYGSSPSDGDLSNTQFALMALDAAYNELGLEKPNPDDPGGWPFKAIKFISRCQNRPASNDQPWAHDTTRPSYNDGGFIYYPGGWSLAGGTDSYGSMTAAGIWSLRLCGVAVADERVQAGLNWLINNEDCSFDDNPGHPYDQAHCFLYYYYMTIAKALTMCFLHDLGEVDWYAALSAKLIALQLEDGHWVNAPASHGMEDIAELATDYALLALQVKQPPPAKLWMSIILASNAELCVYDPQGRHARLDDVTIPGATFEIDEEGRQIVNLTELEAGKYTIELMGIADGDYSLTINGYRDEEQTFSKTFEGTIKKGETLVGSALVTSIVGALTIYTEHPIPPPDAIPPTTRLSIGEPKYVTDTIYVTPDTPFFLDATDNPGGSGVALTAYKIRNATYDSGWLTYTEPFYLTELIDGVYAIDYNSTDNANNVEPTNTINVTLFSWNYVFTDSYGRETTLKINTEHHFFQFITPDKDYGIRRATYMRQCGRAIIIQHCDKELRLITVAVDTKLDFCIAIAWDRQTHKQYFLIDKAGTE
jgi:squalene-hopene/tetraprenyl-beta-curcumene cyclase